MRGKEKSIFLVAHQLRQCTGIGSKDGQPACHCLQGDNGLQLRKASHHKTICCIIQPWQILCSDKTWEEYSAGQAFVVHLFLQFMQATSSAG